LLVGTSSGVSAAFVNSSIQAHGLTGDASSVTLYRFTTSATAAATPRLVMARSGSDSKDFTVVASGNRLGQLNFVGADGSQFVSAASIDCEVDGTPGANDMPGRLVFSTTADGASSPTERMRIQSNGQFNTFDDSGNGIVARSSFGAGTSQSCFIGVRSATNTVNGTPVYQVYTNGAYATIYDQRQKKNIETTRNGYLDDLKQLRVVKYHWNEQGDSEPKELGLIAQEVEQVFPGLVPEMTENGEGETFKGIKTSVLPFMLLKALQEATAKIEALEAAVTALQQS
jgi:hypothetical protein